VEIAGGYAHIAGLEVDIVKKTQDNNK